MTIRWKLDADSLLTTCMCDDRGDDIADSIFTMGCPKSTWSADGLTAAQYVDLFVARALGVRDLTGLSVTIEAPA